MCAEELASLAEIAEKLRALLSAHSEEIEEAVVARMLNSGLDLPTFETEGLVGVRPSAKESLNTMIESFEKGDDWNPVLPPALVAQIRYAARRDVSLEQVMRGAAIIGSVFIDALFQRLDDRDAHAALQYIVAWQGQNQDKMMAAFAAHYTTELERLKQSSTHELSAQVKKLLEGQTRDTSAIDYRFDACHIGLIAAGEKVDLVCKRLAERLGCDLLVVPAAEGTFWVWLGAPREIRYPDLERLVSAMADTLTIGAGEPRDGIVGWRLTHQEAKAAAPVALLEGPGLVRHSSVALLASALCHEETGRSLVDRYLTPLDQHRDADDLRKTLGVYFELSCNAASTASALGVNRHTVQRRLKRVEESIGEPSSARQAEFGVALRLQQLTARTTAIGNFQ